MINKGAGAGARALFLSSWSYALGTPGGCCWDKGEKAKGSKLENLILHFDQFPVKEKICSHKHSGRGSLCERKVINKGAGARGPPRGC